MIGVWPGSDLTFRNKTKYETRMAAISSWIVITDKEDTSIKLADMLEVTYFNGYCLIVQ